MTKNKKQKKKNGFSHDVAHLSIDIGSLTHKIANHFYNKRFIDNASLVSYLQKITICVSIFKATD